METWRQFRSALARLMQDGGVTPGQMVKAGEVPPSAPAGRDVPSFLTVRRSTLYGYLKENDDRVGNGDWQVIDNLLRCIAFVAEANGRRLSIDYDSWQSAWQRLVDQKGARRPSIPMRLLDRQLGRPGGRRPRAVLGAGVHGLAPGAEPTRPSVTSRGAPRLGLRTPIGEGGCPAACRRRYGGVG